MNATLQEILDFCEQEVANGSIYVWGSEGQSAITEKWIRASETSTENANRAIALWQERLAQGCGNIRAFDCSGYVSCGMIVVGLMSGRRDCDGIWARCTRISKPENGAMLFRVSKKDPEDETHIGFYFNGYQYHAKGRDDGVVKEPYDPSYWKKIGWFKTLPHDTKEETSVPAGAPYIQITKSVNVRNEPSKNGDVVYVARNERLPYYSTDPVTGWWAVQTPTGSDGFVSCNIPKYAKLVKG